MRNWGNEAGLGAIKDKTREIMPRGAKCRCPCGKGIATTVEADVTLVVTCSNLGAYGITACLSALLNKPDVLQDAEVEEQMIRECIRAGGMESIQALSSIKTPVDAMPMDAYVGVVKLMKAVVKQELTEIPLAGAEIEE